MIQRWEIRENSVTSNSVYVLVIIGTAEDAAVLQRNLSVFCALTDAKLPPFTHVFELANITDDDMLEKIRIKIEQSVAESGAVETSGSFSQQVKNKPLNLDAITPATEIMPQQEVQFSRVTRGGQSEPLEYTSMPSASDLFDFEPGPSLRIADEDQRVKTKSHFSLAKDELSFKKEYEGINNDIELENDLDVGDGTFINLDTASVKKLKETTHYRPEDGLSGLLGTAGSVKQETVPHMPVMEKPEGYDVMPPSVVTEAPSPRQAPRPAPQPERVVNNPANRVAPVMVQSRPAAKMPSVMEAAPAAEIGSQAPVKKAGGLFNKFLSKFSEGIKKSKEAISAQIKKHEEASPKPVQEAPKPAANPFSSLGPSANPKPAPQPAAKPQRAQDRHSVVVEQTAAPIKSFAKAETVHMNTQRDEGLLTDEIFAKTNQGDLVSKIPVDDIFAAETICEFYADDSASSAPSFPKAIDPSLQEIMEKTPSNSAPAIGDSLLDIPENLLSGSSSDNQRKPVLSSMAPEPKPVVQPAAQPQAAIKPALSQPLKREPVAKPSSIVADDLDAKPEVPVKAAEPVRAAVIPAKPIVKPVVKPEPEPVIVAAPVEPVAPAEPEPVKQVDNGPEIVDLRHSQAKPEPVKKQADIFDMEQLSNEGEPEVAEAIEQDEFEEILPVKPKVQSTVEKKPQASPPAAAGKESEQVQEKEPEADAPKVPEVKKAVPIQQNKPQVPNRLNNSGESKMTQDDSLKITNLAKRQDPQEEEASNQAAPARPAVPQTPARPVPPPAFSRPLNQNPAAPRSNMPLTPGAAAPKIPAARPPVVGAPARPAVPQQPVARPAAAVPPVARPVTPQQPAVRPAVAGVRPAAQPIAKPQQKPVMPGAEKTKTIDHTIQIAIGQIYKKSNWPLEIPLNPIFTFDNMDMASNRFAHATAMSLVENLGAMNNPFVIYGEGGSGKTHFLNAMGYEISRKIAQEKIFMTNGVRFARGIQRYVEEGKTEKLKEFFDSAEVLIIDDIHLTAVNEHNREIISQVLSRFLKEKKQIIISSKYPPESLARFEDLVKFRLDQGWVSELKPPRPQHFTRLYNKMVESADMGLNEVQTHSFFGAENLTLGTISRDIRRVKVLHRRIVDSGMPEKSYEGLFNEMLAINGENEGSEIIKKDFADIVSLQRGENTDWGSFGFFFPQDQSDKFKWIAWSTMQKAKELGIRGGFNFALKSAYSTEHIISSAFKIANICDNKNLKGAIILGPSLSTCQPAIRDNFYDILTHMLEVMMIRCGIIDAEYIKNPSAYVKVLGDVLK